MKRLLLFLSLLFFVLSCSDSDVVPKDAADYFPLQVGNYWKVSEDDYLEVTGKERIQGKEYFQIHSWTKQWGSSYLYLRNDENLNLI